MTVTDHQVATLRAMLAGNRAEHEQLVAQLDRECDNLGYSALVTAAFIRAVSRRFGKKSVDVEVIEFVADARARSDELAEAVDPRVAERLIRKVATGDSTDDIDATTSATAKLLLLAVLIADERLDGAELDEFLSNARKLADYLAS
jgi:transposase